MSKIYYKKSNFLTLSWNNLSDFKLLKKSLQKNQVSIVSTDTVYGFLASITEESFKQIETFKQAKRLKPFIILIDTKEKLKLFVDKVPLKIEAFIDKIWPGPVTIIFKAKKNLPNFVTVGYDTIAIRIPNHKGLLNLLKSFNGLFSTSANTISMPAPTKFEEIEKNLLAKVAFFVDSPEEKKESLASTILDATSPDNIKVLREGAYSKELLEKYYGSKFNN